MKKVVLLAGALAAGMAVAPQAASAAAPKAPISPTINEMDGINATPDLTVAGITQLIADLTDLKSEAVAFQSTPSYTSAAQSVKDKYDQVVNDIQWNIEECNKLIDSNTSNSSLFMEVGDGHNDQLGLLISDASWLIGISEIAPYWPVGGPEVGVTTVFDVFDNLKKALSRAAAPMQYKDVPDAYSSLTAIVNNNFLLTDAERQKINNGEAPYAGLSAEGKAAAIDFLANLDHSFTETLTVLDDAKGAHPTDLDAFLTYLEAHGAFVKHEGDLDKLPEYLQHEAAETDYYNTLVAAYEGVKNIDQLFTTTEAKAQYAEVDEMADVKALYEALYSGTPSLVEQFKTAIDDAYANRRGAKVFPVDALPETCNGCMENKATLDAKLAAISNTDVNAPGLVQQLTKLVNDYKEHKTTNLKTQQDRYNAYQTWHATHDGTDITAANGAYSTSAKSELDAAYDDVKDAAFAAANFIFAFGAPKSVFDLGASTPVTTWGVPKYESPFDTYLGLHAGENDGTHSDLQGYKDQVTKLLKDLDDAIDTYETIYHNAQLNRDAYDKACAALGALKLTDKDKNYGTTTPGTSDKYDVLRDADGNPILDADGNTIEHPYVGDDYYKAEGYDTEVPAARTAANGAKSTAQLNLDQQYDHFQIVEKDNADSKHHYEEVADGTKTKIVDNQPNHTAATGGVADCVKVVDDALAAFKLTTDYTDANTKVTDYNTLVDNANANEAAHDKLLAEWLELAKEATALLDDKSTDGVYNEENTLVNGTYTITELYPNNTEGSYDAADTADKKFWAKAVAAAELDAYGAIDNAYKAAGVADQCPALLAKEIADDGTFKVGGKLKALRDAIDNGIDNEKAYLEGLKKIKDEEGAETELAKEYKDHPEVYADWKTQIDAVLAKYDDVRDNLKEAYDVTGTARVYVTNTIQNELDAIDTKLDELIKKINENKRAYDQNNAAVDQALHDLAEVKADYDTKKFTTKADTTETKDKDVYAPVKTGTPTSLKADLDDAWTEMYADVKAAVEAKIGTTTSDFTLPAAAADFDHDVAFILSKIKSENGVDFNALHYAAAADYTPNLDAVKYIKDEVIPALADKFAELVKANEDAYAQQLATYNETAEQVSYYECIGGDAAKVSSDKAAGVKTAATSILTPAGSHCTKEENAVMIAKDNADAALLNYQTKLEEHYINGESAYAAPKTPDVKAELEGLDADYKALLQTYNDEVDKAKKNDVQFADDYDAILKVGTPATLAPDDVWNVNPLGTIINAPDVNGWSDAADADVVAKYNDLLDAWTDYRKAIKQSWLDEKSVNDKDTNAALLQDYKDAVQAYKDAIEKAKKNDAEYKDELTNQTTGLPAAALTIKDYNNAIARTAADTQLKELLDDEAALRTKVDAAYYQNLKKEIVLAWEEEKLTDKGVAGGKVETLLAKIKQYKDDVTKYNKLVDQINEVATTQKTFNEAKAHVDALEIMTTQLNIDGTPVAWDKDKAGIETAATNIQKDIHTLETQIDKWYHNGTAVTATVAPINTAITNYKSNADTQNGLFKENENAFDSVYADYTFSKTGTTYPVGKGLHDTMLDTLNKANDSSAITGKIAKEAYEKFVAGNNYNGKVQEQIDALETKYKEEDAKNFDPTAFEDLKKKIDYAYAVAVAVGDNMGDLTAEHNTTGDFVNEYDFMYLLNEMILKNRQTSQDYPDCRGDLDLNGLYEANDLVLLSNYIWYKNLDGVQKAQAHRGDFEAELNAEVIGNTVAIAIDNNYEFNALQFDVVVPEGARITDLIATSRAKGLVVSSNEYEQGVYRVVIVGMGANKLISGNDGNVISFNVRGAEGDVEIFNVTAADGISHELNGASVYVGNATSIDEVATEGNTEIFSLDGIRQSVMKAGVNIVRGANGVAKKIFNK